MSNNKLSTTKQSPTIVSLFHQGDFYAKITAFWSPITGSAKLAYGDYSGTGASSKWLRKGWNTSFSIPENIDKAMIHIRWKTGKKDTWDGVDIIMDLLLNSSIKISFSGNKDILSISLEDSAVGSRTFDFIRRRWSEEKINYTGQVAERERRIEYNKRKEEESNTRPPTSRPVRPPVSRPVPTPTPDNDMVRRRQIRDGFRSIKVNPKSVLLNDVLYRDPIADDESFIVAGDECYKLTNTNKTISRQVVYVKGGGYHNIYPGAIVYADVHLTEGSPIPLSGVRRSKLNLFGSFFSQKSNLQSGVEASAGSVHNAIGKMLNELFANKEYQAAGTINYSSNVFTSKKDMMLSFGCDSSFAGANVQVEASISMNESKFVQSTDLEQQFFNIRLNDDYRDDLSKLFADNVTWNDIHRIAKNRPLCIITSVTYGRSVHYLKEFSSKNFNYKGSQKFSGYGQEVVSAQDIAQSSEATKTQFISLGGTDAPSAILKGDKTPAEIEKVLSNTMSLSKSNQGIPLMYKVELISGEFPGTPIEPTFNGNIVTSGYKRCPSYVQLKITMKTWTVLGQKNVKVKFTYDTFRLEKRENKFVKVPSRFNVVDEKAYEESDKPDIRALNLLPGEYVDGYLRLQVRCKASSVSKWYNHISDGLIDASSGYVDLVLKGTTRAGSKNKAYIHSSSPTQLVGSVN